MTDDDDDGNAYGDDIHQWLKSGGGHACELQQRIHILTNMLVTITIQ